MTKLPDFTSIFEGTKAPQPEALRLATKLNDLNSCVKQTLVFDEAATELRRLHEVNVELLAALNNILIGMEASGGWDGDDDLFAAGIAVYKKATGKTE